MSSGESLDSLAKEIDEYFEVSSNGSGEDKFFSDWSREHFNEEGLVTVL